MHKVEGLGVCRYVALCHCSQRVYRQHEGGLSEDWERVFFNKKGSLFLGMMQFVIAGVVIDRSHLRITYFDELRSSGSL